MGKYHKHHKKANRRGGLGRGFTRAVAKHPEEKFHGDSKDSAARMAEQHMPLSAPCPEVLPGISERSFIPSLGRLSNGSEVTDVLLRARNERATILVPRPDRPGKSRPYRPAGALEFAHGQLRLDQFLALRWGHQEGLPSPNLLLDQILAEAPAFLKATYGEGLDVLVVCLHPPNPNLERELRARGWRGVIQDPREGQDKTGGWNLHIQVYVARILDGTFQTKSHLFTHAGDPVLTSMQLRELGVDLDAHRASRFRAYREAAYVRWFETKGCKGRRLPTRFMRKLEAGKLSQAEAITKAIDTALKRKARSWLKAKECRSLVELNIKQVAAAEGSIDLVLTNWYSRKVAEGLPTLHPAYGPLIEKARQVILELKAQQMSGGHRVSLNELLTLWERGQQEERERAKKELEAFDQVRVLEEYHTVWEQARAEINRLRSSPPQVVIKEVAVADKQVLEENAALKAKVAALEAKAGKGLWTPVPPLPDLLELLERVAHGNATASDKRLVYSGKYICPQFFAYLETLTPGTTEEITLHGQCRSLTQQLLKGEAGQIVDKAVPSVGRGG